MKKLVAILLVALVVVSSVVAGGNAETSSDQERTWTIGVSGNWYTHCPWMTNGGGGKTESIVNGLIYDGLVYVNQLGEASPRAAKSWEMSDDYMTVTFHLDERAKWHDGEPVTADDWVWTFQMATDPDSALLDMADFNMIAGTDDATGKEVSENSVGVRAIDDYTLEITFKSPTNLDTWFVSYGGEYRVLPKHILEDYPMSEITTCDFWLNPIGSGPCIFVSEQTSSSITLEANAEYQLGSPGFDTLIVRSIDSANVETSFLAHEIDAYASPLTYEGTQVLAVDPTIKITRGETADLMYLMCVNNRVVDSVDARLAINYAINKQEIIDVLFSGQGVPLESCIAPGSPYFNDAQETIYDPELAKELLRNSGWQQSGPLTLATTADRENIAVMVESYLEAIGLDINILVCDSGTLYGGLFDETIPMGMASLPLTADPMATDQMYDYTRPGYYNVTDPHFLELQNEIDSEMDQSKRIELIKEWQEYGWAVQPATFLCATYSYYAESGHISGFEVGGREYGTIPVWKISVNQ